ncbi:NAD-dependent epimerase/dehydratase family protein [Amycolatopsis circi]|uniref:NAD-dependent epimerase/dehydratase family protein n=1 Tax=Amycolatopsis circi TaxID=871959 RepID=UPI000E22DA83|nr:SDR family NAD(P)-dependent oxidoreductase [Amycolatopsis circi]
MSKVVVTGGCGFIGSHLVEQLIARGDRVTVFDRTPPPPDQALAREHAEFVAGDIRDADRLASVVTNRVDVVYHLAAVVGVDQYLAQPVDVIDTNFSATRAVVDLTTTAGSLLVLASTSEVFGKNPVTPWREDGDRVLGPTSAARWTYSTSKALSEHLVTAFVQQHGLNATIVRYFNAYGPRQRPAYIVSRSVHRALNGHVPVVYDDGSHTRCFTYIDDIIEGTLLAATSSKALGESFNLGSMTETTVAEVVGLIRQHTGFAEEAVTVRTAEQLTDAYQDVPRRVPDNTKAADLLGWRPETSLPDGIAKTVAWARTADWWLAQPDHGAR